MVLFGLVSAHSASSPRNYISHSSFLFSSAAVRFGNAFFSSSAVGSPLPRVVFFFSPFPSSSRGRSIPRGPHNNSSASDVAGWPVADWLRPFLLSILLLPGLHWLFALWHLI